MKYFVALDGEMTGSTYPVPADIKQEGKVSVHPYDFAPYALIQIGLSAQLQDGSHTTMCSDIKAADYIYEERALEVNGFTHNRIKRGIAIDVVDRLCVEWVNEYVTHEPGSLILVGWNVAGFDMLYVRKYLPRLWELVGYRSKDLNSSCFDLARAYSGGTMNAYNRMKKKAKDYAESQMVKKYGEAAWHNAGFDAEASLHSWDWIIDRMRQGNASSI